MFFSVQMIMEFMEGGTLSQALKAWSFKEPQIAYFAREVLRGTVEIKFKKLTVSSVD
jgi:serine/threonine protein kinase